MILYVIILIAGMWLLQSVFGFFQLKSFNKTYAEMRRLGRAAIGRNTAMFRAGTVVIFAIDRQNKILASRRMQGVTVFSRMRKMDGFDGKNLLKLTDEDLSKVDKLTKLAIKDAIRTCQIVAAGGEVPIKKSLFARLIPSKN